MLTLRVYDILKSKILVGRESARALEEALREAISGANEPQPVSDSASIVVDFCGVEGMAPSFLDELLLIFESLSRSDAHAAGRRLRVENPPTRLSRKFEATARGHGLSIRALDDGSWLLTDERRQRTQP